MAATNSISVVVLHPGDNTAVAARDLAAGDTIQAAGHSVRLRESIRLGHKLAMEAIAPGAPVRKYGQTIGFALAEIAPGEWVHVHNVSAERFSREYEFSTAVPPDPTPITDRTFQGFRRADGRVGTRNYLAVISSVNCSATVCKMVAQRVRESGLLRDFPHVDGVIPIAHGAGCGIQYGGEYHQLLSRSLGGMAKHPNIGGYLLIGLGCETGEIGYIVRQEKLVQIASLGEAASRARPITLSMQELGGTQRTVDAALHKIQELLPRLNALRRETVPASEIILGTNCGGSDGNSGVTANPALGIASDLLVACGATTILAETSEVYGAEQLLTRRARTPEVGQKLIDRIKWWEWYADVFGATLDNNPSPGNKEGGLTTIYEKSLGAIAKAGSTALNAVYLYAEQVTEKGFVLMDTPGFDAVSVTGIVAGGANAFVFTTGRGSCFGCKPTPSIKVATNTPMFERMRADMDLNAGTILSEGRSIESVGREIFEEILRVASGQQTKSEQLGYGDEEFVPWPLGPTL
ncbi:MAG TPA: altronate dehydratase family protein [Pirellulales bacterium]|jgi:altronate hydrolase|nr:altronate dehydratase family protein [Pirellulales bacterium]